MTQIRTRRWDDPALHDDGTRILICRYRPRGLAKSLETWNEWIADLAPSKELHAAAYGKDGRAPLDWNSYRASYLREMSRQTQSIAALAKRVLGGETITLLCSSQCVREARCHRSLLKELIDRQIAKIKN